MTTKESIIEEIQKAADADGDPQMQISMGTPGETVKNIIEELQKTGQAWIAAPSALSIMMEGIAKATERIYVTFGNKNISEFEAGSIIEYGDDDITITLDDPLESVGKFIIKGKGHTNQIVAGTIDDTVGPSTISGYGVLRVYSNGGGWHLW